MGPMQPVQRERVGSWVGAGIAVVTGGALTVLGAGSLALCLSVVTATIGVALFAWRAGGIAARWIEGHGLLRALGIGVVGALLSLAVAALMASAVGGFWGLWDGLRSGRWADAWSYLGKPAFAVLLYGAGVAIGLGILAGLLIFVGLRRLPRGGSDL